MEEDNHVPAHQHNDENNGIPLMPHNNNQDDNRNKDYDNLDEDGFLRPRDRATAEEIFHNKFAVIDHISGKQCTGCEQGTFFEVQKSMEQHAGYVGWRYG